jgi:hypothetical protein
VNYYWKVNFAAPQPKPSKPPIALVLRDLSTGTPYAALKDMPDSVLANNQERITCRLRARDQSLDINYALDCYNLWQHERQRRKDLVFLQEAVNQ